jgi:SnoaL-like domain
MDGDARARARIMEHWRASEQGDSAAEHAIYAADAILDYPQSGERFRGRATIAAQRGGHPAERHFTVLRISGNGDIWVSECVITYDGVTSYSVSVMEFTGGLVAMRPSTLPTPSTRPRGGPRWPSRCRTVQADAGDRDSSMKAPGKGNHRADPRCPGRGRNRRTVQRSSLMRIRLPAGSRNAQSRIPYGCSVGSCTTSAPPASSLSKVPSRSLVARVMWA